MKPWLKLCLIFMAVYCMFSGLIYFLSKNKGGILGIFMIGLGFNIIIFMKYRKCKVKPHKKGKILRVKSPLRELYEKLLDFVGVRK